MRFISKDGGIAEVQAVSIPLAVASCSPTINFMCHPSLSWLSQGVLMITHFTIDAHPIHSLFHKGRHLASSCSCRFTE